MAVACVLLLLCAAGVNVSVFLRYIFQISFQWTEEIVKYLHIGVVILLCGPLLWTGGHITMDLILMKLKGPVRKIVRMAGEAVTLILVGYTFLNSISYVASLKATGIRTFSTKFQQWMPTAVVPVGFFFATVFCAGLLIREIVQFRQADAADESLQQEIADILESNQLDVGSTLADESEKEEP